VWSSVVAGKVNSSDSARADPFTTSSSATARRAALVDSLRSRFAEACRRDDAAAKQALFREAVYLGIQPEAFS